MPMAGIIGWTTPSASARRAEDAVDLPPSCIHEFPVSASTPTTLPILIRLTAFALGLGGCRQRGRLGNRLYHLGIRARFAGR
jgi:hypothetical protein